MGDIKKGYVEKHLNSLLHVTRNLGIWDTKC